MTSKKHVVKQGETLASIAALNGFSDFKPIFSHPDNAELRKKRKDPNILFPGDIVAIPAARPKTVVKPSGAVATFVLASTQLRLELRMLDPFDKPLAEKSCELRNDALGPDGKPTGSIIGSDLKTDDKGRTGANIAPSVVDAELKVFATVPLPFPIPKPPTIEKYDLIVGGLDPVVERSGLRGRLNNLGYFAGLGDGPEDREQLFWAIEEFQFDNAIKPQNGDFDDPSNKTIVPTRKKLVEVHGDKEPI
jgi:N-acetylmuramoyl-L-alanine amidase